MKKIKKILCLILALATLMSVPMVTASAETPDEEKELWEIALESGYFTYDVTGVSGSSHMQGICVDDDLEYMYFSYTDTLAKISMKTGEVVGTVSGFGTGSYLAEGGAHIGCLAYYNGRIYGSLEYKSPGKKWFIISFDENAITEVGMDFMDMETGVDGILLADPTADFRNVLNDGDLIDSPDGFAQNEENLGHAYGCSGIDGITFGTMPGDTSGKIYCFVAYGIYKWTDRYDNNYNILKVYDPEDLDERYDPATGTGDKAVRRFVYERGVNPVYEEDELLYALDTLYAWTGATNYGVQNLEFNKDTGDLEMYTYGTTKSWENWTRKGLFIIDGSVAPVEREIEVGQSNTNPDQAAHDAAVAKAECYKVNGEYPTGKHVAIKCICGGDCQAETWGDTGFTSVLCGTKVPVIATYGTISLGNNYYYLADGNHSVSLYHRDENYNFTRVTTYEDVTGDHWALNAIEAVTAAGLFNGTGEKTFSPEADTTRGQLMTVLARLSGADTSGNAIEKGVAWAVANGVSDGTNPDGSITREQLVTMIYRFCGSPAVTGDLSAYTDAGSVSDWAKDAMLWAVSNGISSGRTDTTFDPNASVTREELVTMLWRFAGKPDADTTIGSFTDSGDVSGWSYDAIQWAIENDVMNGSDGALLPKGSTTRAQLAQFILNFVNAD